MAQRRGRSREGAQSQCHLGPGHPWGKGSERNDPQDLEAAPSIPSPTLGLRTSVCVCSGEWRCSWRPWPAWPLEKARACTGWARQAGCRLGNVR